MSHEQELKRANDLKEREVTALEAAARAATRAAHETAVLRRIAQSVRATGR